MRSRKLLQIVNSFSVISICLIVVGAFLSIFKAPDDEPFAVLGALFCLPISIVAGVFQYSATFRNSLRAARRITMFFAGLFFFSLFVFVGTLCDCLPRANWQNLPLIAEFLAPFLLASGLIGLSWRLNAAWRDALLPAKQRSAGFVDSLPSEIDLREPPSQSLIERSWGRRDALALSLALMVVGAIVSSFGQPPPREALHVTGAQAWLSLPEHASDVCVRRGSRGTITYEFSIDEVGFWEWAKSGHNSFEAEMDQVPIEPISRPVSILGLTCLPENPVEQFIFNGWSYRWSREDRGCAFVFDSDHNRVYYNFHAH